MEKNRKSGFIMVLLLAIVVAVGVMIVFASNGSKGASKTATRFLTQLFTCTQQDYKEFDRLLTGNSDSQTTPGISSSPDDALRNYFSEKYPELMTEHGYEQGMAQRVLTKGMNLANDNKMDLQVQKVTLQKRSGDSDIIQFDFEVITANIQDAAKTFTATGTIGILEEDGVFKVDAVSVNSVA